MQIRFLENQFTKIGKGTYNVAYACQDGSIEVDNHKGPWVIKQQLSTNHEKLLDQPERIARIVKEIYPDIPSKILKDEKNDQTYLLFPYLKTPVSREDEKAVATELLRIYKNTRRIIFDGCLLNNFKKDASGRVICIDTGLALRRGSCINLSVYQKDNLTEIAELKFFQSFFKKKEDEEGPNYLPLKVIKHIIYLEGQLEPQKIKDAYLEYHIILWLHDLVTKKHVIPETLLETIADLHTRFPALFAFFVEQNIPFSANFIKILSGVQQALGDQFKEPGALGGLLETIAYLHKQLPKSFDFMQEKGVLFSVSFMKMLAFIKQELLQQLKLNNPTMVENLLETTTNLHLSFPSLLEGMIEKGIPLSIHLLQALAQVKEELIVLSKDSYAFERLPQTVGDLYASIPALLEFVIRHNAPFSLDVIRALAGIKHELLTLSRSPAAFEHLLETIRDLHIHFPKLFHFIIHHHLPFSISLVKALACVKQELPHRLKYASALFENVTLQKAIAAAYDYLTANPPRLLPSTHGHRGKGQTMIYLERLLSHRRISEKRVKKEMRHWLEGYGFFKCPSSHHPCSRTAFAKQSGVLTELRNVL